MLLKSDRCLYCGAATDGPGIDATRGSRLPADAIIALEPRPREVDTGSKWMRRVIAIALAGLLIVIVVLLTARS